MGGLRQSLSSDNCIKSLNSLGEFADERRCHSLNKYEWGRTIGNSYVGSFSLMRAEILTLVLLANSSDGLLRTVETSAKARQTDMDDALQDLEALMIKARDMVKLAGDLNDRLTASSSLASNPYSSSGLSPTSTTNGISPEQATSFSSSATLIPSTEPEEATFIRSSLAQLGLQMQNTSVTLDMIRDEKRWHEELARELSGVLQGTGGKGGATGIMGERGIIGLDEVWGSWNRARGIGTANLLIFIPLSIQR